MTILYRMFPRLIKKKLLSKNKGFTLLEVIISIGILGILAFSTVSATKLLVQSTDYGDKSQGLMSLVSQIRERTKYSNLCDNAIGAASAYNQNNLDLANPEIRLLIPNIKAGISQTDNFVGRGQIVAALRLQIDSLRLDNIVNVGGTKYVAQIMMNASAIGGMTYKPVYISSVQIELQGTSPNMSIARCIGVESVVTEPVCESMGCTWDPAAMPQSCSCIQASGLCPLGELPIAVKMGMPDCRPVGGKACAANEYLVGVTIEKSICAPAR